VASPSEPLSEISPVQVELYVRVLVVQLAYYRQTRAPCLALGVNVLYELIDPDSIGGTTSHQPSSKGLSRSCDLSVFASLTHECGQAGATNWRRM
jgi:hypothetical protein